MEKFLQKVANDLKKRHGRDLSQIAVVFPNKRAALFFNKYLVEDDDTPVWAPKYLTISELFAQANPSASMPDTIELVCRLYKAYCHVANERNKHAGNGKQISIEPLDYFYQWGEMLLSDFDDIDKCMIDAKAIFKHIDDWNKMEDASFVDEEMEKRIKDFFTGFSIDKMTKLKERFITMWENLYDIYRKFNDDLAREQLSYEGALYRKTAESRLVSNLPYSTFAFIGFNVIDEVEKTVFRQLADDGRALFYWDYDEEWKGTQATKFVKSNIDEFGNALPQGTIQASNCGDISIVSSKTGNLQAQFARQWVAENITDDECDTALILCDEKQLQQVLHSMPANVNSMNVTMGYPLSETPAMSFVNCLTELQESYDPHKRCFSHKPACKLLRHPYTAMLSPSANKMLGVIMSQNLLYPAANLFDASNGISDEALQSLFAPQTGNLAFCSYLSTAIANVAVKANDAGKQANDEQDASFSSQLCNESLFQAYTTATRLANLVESNTLQVSRQTLAKLITRVMQGKSMPFHGEPAEGLQVMGMLETRNLDFKHVIMLDVNEGMLPKNDDKPSFIPPILRRAYGMTTPERRVAVFAYYFFRLAKRCRKLCLVYNDEVENGKKNEMSRFAMQILATMPAVKRYELVPNLKISKAPAIAVKRDSLTLERLKQRFNSNANASGNIADWLSAFAGNPEATKGSLKTESNANGNRKILSPSAINTYLDCQLMFYFKYIAGLKPTNELSNDIDMAMFGTIFHASAEEIYARLSKSNNFIDKQRLDEATRSLPIDRIVDFHFRKHFFKHAAIVNLQSHEEETEKGIHSQPADYNGLQLVNKEVITKLLGKLLEIDKHLAGFKYIGSEINVGRNMQLGLNDGSTINLTIGGTIDRMDFIAAKQPEQGGTMRIVDYKTGASEAKAKDLESVFEPSPNRSGYHLQTLLYASITCDMTHGKMAIEPCLLYIQKQNKDKTPALKIGREEINDIRPIKHVVDERIAGVVNDIFNGKEDFTQTTNNDTCKFCDFKAMCRK